MGTSNWQNIPFCVEALMKIAPERVLDVGVGFGRWGMIVREFCDVWYGRVSPDAWTVHIEGIEAFPKNVAPYHGHFYAKIHTIDAADFFRTVEDAFDVIIFGDVLEHFTKHVGRELLRKSLEVSTYTLVNIPLGEDWHQDEAYENPYERHLASWTLADFASLPVVRRAMFTDYAFRPFASIVLSATDPKNLAAELFSKTTSVASDGDGTEAIDEDMQRALARASEVRFELDFIRRHSSYRLATRLRRTPLWNALRWARTRNADTVTIRALGRKNASAKGAEVWLLAARPADGVPSVPWDFMEIPNGAWERPAAPRGSYGIALKATKGTVRLPLYAKDPILTFMTHPWGGQVEIRYRGHRHLVDLYSPEADALDVRPARAPAAPPRGSTISADVRALSERESPADGGDACARGTRRRQYSPAEERWLRQTRQENVAALAIHVPRWLGVTAATRILFEHLYPFPGSPDADPSHADPVEVKHHARLILESGVRHVVCSGGERLHYDLMREIKRESPEVRCDLLWHGTYVQCHEDYVWSILQLWIAAAKDGLVHTIGTVKRGMEEFFASLGCRSRFVMNYVPEVPAAASEPAPGGPHLGLWISGYSYRKLPFAMLAAAKMVPGAVLHGSNFVRRVQEVVDAFQIPTGDTSSNALPETRLLEAIRKTHLSLYVTFSECCPMLPLQSLSVGVPCLTGPTSHLFQDDEYLYRRLVVPFPDRADVIADYITAALGDREQIVAAYRQYAPAYNERARESVRRFLSADL